MKKCNYCKEEDIEINLDNTTGLWTNLSMCYNKDDNTWYIVAEGDDMASIKINYCPFCGRELNSKYKIKTKISY